MEEKFSNKAKGDRLYHGEVNDVFDVCRRFGSFKTGSNISSTHGKSFFSETIIPPWYQRIVEITNKKVDETDTDDSGFYLCKLRYYNFSSGTDWKIGTWESQDKEWRLDASDFGVEFEVGDKTIAYWDEQRSAFIPIIPQRQIPLPLVDYNSSYGATLPSTGWSCGDSDINFALEISNDGTTGWQVVNNRVCRINGNVKDCNDQCNGKASGYEHYTFRITAPVWLRVRANTNITWATITVDRTSIRFQAYANEGIAHSLGTALSPAVTISGWALEAEVNNDGPLDGFPAFSVVGSLIKITPPLVPGSTSTYQTWTIDPGVSTVFDIRESLSSQSSSMIEGSSSSSCSTSMSSSSSCSTSESSLSKGESESSPSSLSSTSCSSSPSSESSSEQGSTHSSHSSESSKSSTSESSESSESTSSSTSESSPSSTSESSSSSTSCSTSESCLSCTSESSLSCTSTSTSTSSSASSLSSTSSSSEEDDV